MWHHTPRPNIFGVDSTIQVLEDRRKPTHGLRRAACNGTPRKKRKKKRKEEKREIY